MNNELMQSQTIIKYEETCIRLLKTLYPNITYNELIPMIEYSINKRFKNSELELDNNYKKKKLNSTVLEMADYIISREPILTAHGVLFKKHGTVPNPIGKMIKGFMDNRNLNKQKMFQYPKGSEDFEKYNLFQLLDKLDANALYGTIGSHSCIYFNLYIAPSITAQGRSCISAAGLQFEMFLSNGVKFISLDEIVTFIDNVCSENRIYNDNDIIDRNITIEETFTKIIMTCDYTYIPDEEDLSIVWGILNNLSQTDLNRLYYKNNLYEFVNNSLITNHILNILQSMQSPFMNPNEPNEEIKEELDILCNLLMEYVYYNHQLIDRQDKYANMTRNVCILTDTDSTIISLDAWYRFVLDKTKNIDMKIKQIECDVIDFLDLDVYGNPTKIEQAIHFVEPVVDYDFYEDDIIEIQEMVNPLKIIPQDNLRYSIINILAYCLSKIINDYMLNYTKNSNTYKDGKKCLLIMKNEFLFKRVLCMENAKKHYASIQELQEGHIIPKNKGLDIKGLELMKSSTNERTDKALKEIIYEEVLNAENVDIIEILKKLAIFEKTIYNSLINGEKDFLKPARIKSMNSYDDPLGTFGIKQALVWNMTKYDSLPIIDLESNNSLFVVKMDITPKNVDKIKDTYPDVYEKLCNILDIKEFNKKINGIAIPVGDLEMPKWVYEFIDYTSIINDNLKLFPIEPLGIYRGGKNNNYTNIINI